MLDGVMTIDKECLEETAIKYFCEACGFDTEKEKHNKMFEEALLVRDKIIDKINIRTVVRHFNEKNLSGQTLTLDNVTLHCNVFEQFDNDNVKGIYAYVLTAGDAKIEDDESVLNMYYAYTWGTAYVDAGRDFIEKRIKEACQESNKDSQVFVSDSFGPGYYGMSTDEISKLFELVDAEKIGVKLIDSTMMNPVKSCSGIYIAINNKNQLPKVDCKACISNPNGCRYCRIKKS